MVKKLTECTLEELSDYLAGAGEGSIAAQPPRAEFLLRQTKAVIEATEYTKRQAEASIETAEYTKRYTKYIFWTVVFAALSTFISALSVIISLVLK